MMELPNPRRHMGLSVKAEQFFHLETRIISATLEEPPWYPHAAVFGDLGYLVPSPSKL